MRFYILDDLVSPSSGRELRVENATVTERDGPSVTRCVRWCGRRGAPAESATPSDCRTCARLWVDAAVLSDGIDSYPVIAGIPRFVGDNDQPVDGDTQESFGCEWQHFDKVLPMIPYAP